MDPQDRIIDACLEELLGNEQPPDLTKQILARWDAARPNAHERVDAAHKIQTREDAEERLLEVCLEEMLGGAAPPAPPAVSANRLDGETAPVAERFEPAAPPLPTAHTAHTAHTANTGHAAAVDEPLPPPLPSEETAAEVAIHTANRRARRSRGRMRSRDQLAKALMAISAAALACVLGYWAVRSSSNSLATNTDNNTAPQPTDPSPTAIAKHENPTPVAPTPSPKSPDPKSPNPKSPQPIEGPLFPIGNGIAANPAAGADSPVRREPLHPSKILSDEQVVATANNLLATAWTEAGIETREATDEQWCRRLYLRMLGRIPTVDELQAFAADQRPGRREQLLDALQTDERYAEEYAAHWASFWGTVLVGRRGGMDADDSASRQHLEEYLVSAIAGDKPYDDMVRELIVAEGSGRPGASDYNPATNFLLASMDDGGDKKSLLATTRTFEAFHGRQVKCIQCHSHPTNDGWTQKQFWSFNAFFRQMKVKRGGSGPALVDHDFRGEGPGGIDEAEVFFEQLNGETVAALPSYPGQRPVSPSGRLDDVQRREVLAEFMTRDPQLGVAAVNRIWSHFHGYGFTRPINDMGPHNPASHPELLELLAAQFEGQGFPLNRLVRWVASVDSFNRSSEMVAVADGLDMPESGGRPLFSRYYTRQLQPEAVYDSLRMVAEAGPRDTSLEGRSQWLGQFIQPMGTDEGQELSTFGGDVRQSLIIMNGPLMKRATNVSNQDGILHRVAQSSMNFEQKVEHLFMAAVARKPTRREFKAIGTLRSKSPKEAIVLESIWWALLNSNEFILDH